MLLSPKYLPSNNGTISPFAIPTGAATLKDFSEYSGLLNESLRLGESIVGLDSKQTSRCLSYLITSLACFLSDLSIRVTLTSIFFVGPTLINPKASGLQT
jgi:hypothetical protein